MVLSHGGKCVHASFCMNCISISGKREALAFALRRAQAKKIKKVQKEYYLLSRCIAYGNSDLEMMKCTKDHKSICADLHWYCTCFVPRSNVFLSLFIRKDTMLNAQLRSSLKCILAPDAHTWYIYMLLVGGICIYLRCRCSGRRVARVTVLGCDGPKCAVAWCTPFRPSLTHFDAKDSALRCTYGILFTTGELFQTHCSQVRQLHRQRSGQIAIDASTDARQHQDVHAFSCIFHIA